MATAREYADAARANYDFFYGDGRRLFRRPKGRAHVERLVNGEWVLWTLGRLPTRSRKRSRADDDDDGYGLDTGELSAAGSPDETEANASGNSEEPLTGGRLARLARKYVIADLLDRPRLTGRKVFWHRRPWLALGPPLNGGAPHNVTPESANCSRDAYFALMSGTRVTGDDRADALEQLRDQAELGDGRQRDRGTGAETRANYFAGAAGLTTTLVLANAGLLLGQSRLDNPLRWMAGLALFLASACAVMTGVRALQASMVTFSRCPANSVSRVVLRRKEDELADLECRYIAALLTSQNRNSVVADWKISRLQEARSWFAGVLAGVVVVTVLVLIQAVF